MHHPLISIIMSVYSEPKEWIQKTIESVLNQTITNFEYIIVHDNPSDVPTREFLKRIAANENRIQLIFNEQNIGLTKSLNVAIPHALGKYIARVDADDIWHANKLELQFDYMQRHPELDVCGSCVNFIDEADKFITIMDFPLSHKLIGCTMVETNPIIHSSVFFKSEIIQNRHPFFYNEEFRSSQDYELWSQLYLNGARFANLPDRLVEYRISSNQITKKRRAEQLNNAELIKSNYVNAICLRNGIVQLWDAPIKYIIIELKKISSSLDKDILYRYLYIRLMSYNTSKLDKVRYIINSKIYLHISLKMLLKMIIR